MHPDIAQVLLGLASTIIMILLAIIAYLIKADRSKISREIQESREESHTAIEGVKTQVERLQHEMQLLKDSLPVRFIDRQVWTEFKDDFKAMRLMMEDQLSQMRTFMSSALARIETRLNQKQDK